MTRTGLSPRLSEHAIQPIVEVNSADALRFGVSDGGFAELSSPFGTCILRVRISSGQRQGSVFAPIHWSGETAALSRISDLVAPANDPHSGQPESKASRCGIRPKHYRAEGLLVSRHGLNMSSGAYWARVHIPGGFLYSFAIDALPGFSRGWLDDSLHTGAHWEIADYSDDSAGIWNEAGFAGDSLEYCAFTTRSGGKLPDPSFLKAALGHSAFPAKERAAILSGLAIEGAAAAGPTICACFSVGQAAIEAAISKGCRDVASIGAALKAGTNCGSCQPELKRIIRESLAPMA